MTKLRINLETGERETIADTPDSLARIERDKTEAAKRRSDRDKVKLDKNDFLDSLTPQQLKGFKAILKDGNLD